MYWVGFLQEKVSESLKPIFKKTKMFPNLSIFKKRKEEPSQVQDVPMEPQITSNMHRSFLKVVLEWPDGALWCP